MERETAGVQTLAVQMIKRLIWKPSATFHDHSDLPLPSSGSHSELLMERLPFGDNRWVSEVLGAHRNLTLEFRPIS